MYAVRAISAAKSGTYGLDRRFADADCIVLRVQAPLESHKQEELVLKKMKQLIPLKPTMPKNLVSLIFIDIWHRRE